MDLPDLLKRKNRAYKRVFSGADGALVLADLVGFCHARKTTHVIGDTHGTAQLEGRRQVWLRIQAQLEVTEAQIYQILQEAET